MDRSAKATGLLVFLAGIALMVVVFVAALDMLHGTRAAALDVKRLPQEGIALLARIGFLFVLAFVASAVAGRGIRLFEAVRPSEPSEAPVKTAAVAPPKPD